MRLYCDRISGVLSLEWPARGGQVEQTVKALTGEIVQLRFVEGGVPVLLSNATAIAVSVRAAKGAALLAEVTSFTAPETAAGGFYEGRMSLATTAVQDLLDASPTKNTFNAVAAVSWTIPTAEEPEESDDLVLQLQRKVGSTDAEDPLVLITPWEWIKARVLAGDNLTRGVDDDAQTLTFAGEDGEANAAAIAAHIADVANPHAVTKEQVGLSNVDNTSDADKPVSDATQAALDGKAAVSDLEAYLRKENNLFDLEDAGHARTALGLGDAATYNRATQSEAEAGTSSVRLMTPLRTKQAIALEQSARVNGDAVNAGLISAEQTARIAGDLARMVRIPVRLVAPDAFIELGDYELLTVPRGFQLQELVFVFDGPDFVAPHTLFGFTLKNVNSFETIPILNHSQSLQDKRVTISAYHYVSERLRLTIEAFDGVGYAGSGAKGGVVWLGGVWA